MKKKKEEFDEEIILNETDDINEIEADEIIEEKKPKKKKKKPKKKEKKIEEPVIIREIDDEEAEEIIRKRREKKDDIIVLEDTKETKKKRKKKNKKKNPKKLFNIFFIIIVLLIVMVTADIVLVSKFDKGPFFAIPVKTYDDGGSKEYYGLGYKVIKYKQLQGRRDKVLGSWKLKYNVEPTTVQAIDLAIEFNNNETKAYQKYYKQFVRIVGTLKDIDTYNNVIVIGYEDEDGKYTIDVRCKMATDYSYLEELSLGEEITVIGSVTKYSYKTEKSMSRLYLDNVFAEQ